MKRTLSKILSIHQSTIKDHQPSHSLVHLLPFSVQEHKHATMRSTESKKIVDTSNDRFTSTTTHLFRATIVKLLILSCFNTTKQITLFASSLEQNYIVKVCQNKHCIKQFITQNPSERSNENLINTFQMLLHQHPIDKNKSILIESSGCLSKCGNGPNISITKKTKGLPFLFSSNNNDDEVEISHVTDAYAVADALKKQCDYECPSLLLAAADVIIQTNDSCKYLF